MLVIIRGAGDIATGIALRLHRAGYRLILTPPSAAPSAFPRPYGMAAARWKMRKPCWPTPRKRPLL